MLEIIARQRLPFVILFSVIMVAAFWRGGWRSRLMGAAVGTMTGSAVVMVAILFNTTQLWWLPPGKQTPLTFDVPELLHPIVAPVEAIAADQLHLQAAVVAMQNLAYYALAVVVAMIVFNGLMIWKYIEFQRDVRFVRQVLKNNPRLLDD